MTSTINLKPINVPFQIYFSWNKRRDVSDDKAYWFTPKGNCKVHIGSLHTEHLSKVSDADREALHKMMVDNKTDFLTDGVDYFTTSNNTIIKINNGREIMRGAMARWEAGGNSWETWEAKDEYVEDVEIHDLEL